MISQLKIALGAALCAAALLVPSAAAQGRGGMRGAPAARARGPVRVTGRERPNRQSDRRLLNNYGLFYPPYFYPWDEYDYGPVPPEALPDQPVQMIAPQFAAPASAAIPSASPLLLENHDGQWVRVPTGDEMPLAPQTTKPQSASVAANPRPGYVELPAAAPAPPLPPAVIVFRDGHTEEIGKYMIQGTVLYTSADYYSTGSWTRTIPLSELDIPASLKINKERGTNFNLPSGPNEVMVRF